jgi:hypothetical protein
MANRWIYSEDIGNGVFNIAQMGSDGFKFVWVDKHGIANIFPDMGEFVRYCEGETDVARACVEPYETDREGYDFIDDFLNMDEVN